VTTVPYRRPLRSLGHVRRGASWLLDRPAFALLAIVVVGVGFRLVGIDWDDGAHQHPDERYLSIVASAIEWPPDPGGYFDVERSPLSPYNTEEGVNYVYGVLPLNATKAVGALIGRDSYDELYIVGRTLSATVDAISIVLVFLIARLVFAHAGRREARAAALVAASLYAVTVTAIQHAHFFTVESWVVLFTLATFYAAALVARSSPTAEPNRSLLLLVATGGAFALAVASKVSAAFVAVPVAVALVAHVRRSEARSLRARIAVAAAPVLAVAASAYIVFRLVSPYVFEASSWLDARPNVNFREALEEQRALSAGSILIPPAYQWFLSTPLLDPLRNEIVWGLGVPLGIAAVAGVVWLAHDVTRQLVARRRSRRDAAGGVPPAIGVMLLAFVLGLFFYIGSRFTNSIRYLLPIVPLLCICAAFALMQLRRWNDFVGRATVVAIVGGTALYAVAFVHIYRTDHTRIAASAWIADHVPRGSLIVHEHWDDALPVNADPAAYRLAELPVFEPDDATKLRKLYDGLGPADYYALSSPRAWNTIGRLPDRFPIMTRFYRLLGRGELGFQKAAQFTSFPQLLGVELEDTDAEETFWVYDHPPVILYVHTDRLSWAEFRTTLCAGAALPGCP
jgi:hypothetical protein